MNNEPQSLPVIIEGHCYSDDEWSIFQPLTESDLVILDDLAYLDGLMRTLIENEKAPAPLRDTTSRGRK